MGSASVPQATSDEVDATPTNEVFRDITRGGLAGLIVGIVLAGIGGRLVMRLAALLVPGAAGGVTENGNVIGTITLAGSAALVVFVGPLFGAVAGSLWVVIRPWLPGGAAARALVTIPIAIGLGTAGLVDERNRDFAILGRDPLVVASLLVLVGLFGPALVAVDAWLERRLPHPGPGEGRIVAGYGVVTVLGLILTFLVVLPLYLGSDMRIAGFALVAVGVCTLASWWFRVERGHEAPPRLVTIARIGVVVATIAGLAVATSEVLGALEIG